MSGYVNMLRACANFKFCTHSHGIDRNKSPLKMSGKLDGHSYPGSGRDSQKFSFYDLVARHSSNFPARKNYTQADFLEIAPLCSDASYLSLKTFLVIGKDVL